MSVVPPRRSGTKAKAIQQWGELQQWSTNIDDDMDSLFRSLEQTIRMVNVITNPTGFTSTLTNHAATHLPGGSDPLATAIPVALGSALAIGVANAFSRSDHVHVFPPTLRTTDASPSTLTLTDDNTNQILTGSLGALLVAPTGSSFGPSTDATKDNGSLSLRWKDGFFSGTLTAATISAAINRLTSTLSATTLTLTDSVTDQTLTGSVGNLILTPASSVDITKALRITRTANAFGTSSDSTALVIETGAGTFPSAIVAGRDNPANEPFTGITFQDDGAAERIVSFGGGGVGFPDATTVVFFAAPSYSEVNNTAVEVLRIEGGTAASGQAKITFGAVAGQEFAIATGAFVASALLPSVTNSFNLGSAAKRWNNFHIADILCYGELEVDGAINHDGTTAANGVGFFGVTPVARPAATDDIKDALTTLGLHQGTSASPLNLDGGTLTCGEAAIAGALNHDGSTIGFFGTTPATQQAAGTEIKAALAAYGLLIDGSASALNLDGGTLTCGEADIDADLNHDGSNVGFYGTVPIAKPSSTTDLRQALINLGLYTTGGATPLDLNGGKLTCNEAEINGDLNHDGANLGFAGTAPIPPPGAYAVTNHTTDRAFDADTVTLPELADVVGTIITDLNSLGLFSV